jgi:hypothetical protein
MIHWSLIGFISFIIDSIFCSKGHAICRPQLLFFYLQNSIQETKFQRDPVALIFLSSILVIVSILQFSIEMMKRRFKRAAEKAAKDAEAAKRNLDEAKQRLENNDVVRNNAEMNSDASVTLSNLLQNTTEYNSSIREVEVAASSYNPPGNHHLSQDDALKVARVVTFFAVLPASIFLFLFTLENIDEWRPHGTTASNMIAFGIIVPVLFFIGNLKLRNFAISYLRNKFNTLKVMFRSDRVAPIISINV